MAVMALQIVGLVMGFLGLILQIASTCSNTWRVSSNADSVISATWVFEGLWMNCAASALGSVQCKWFRGLLGLDSLCVPGVKGHSLTSPRDFGIPYYL